VLLREGDDQRGGNQNTGRKAHEILDVPVDPLFIFVDDSNPDAIHDHGT
jgi:hypothetical protein